MKAYNKYEVDEIFSNWQSDLDQLDVIEVYTKSDMVAMLEELKEQLREMHEDFFETEYFDEACGVSDSMDIIQQRIDKLKEGT